MTFATPGRSGLLHPDYYRFFLFNRSVAFFLDLDTLTVHGVEEHSGNSYYTGTKKFIIETGADGKLGIYIEDYSCHTNV